MLSHRGAEQSSAGTATAPPAVEAVGLGKSFGNTDAVVNLDLTVPPGEVFGFLGPNGAGKSTTIRLLLGFLRPTTGSARVFGVPADDVAVAHRHLAHVPADVALWPQLTGQEHLDLLAGVGPGTDLAYRDELVQRFAMDPGRRARACSTGNRQKVALVAAFATRAALLVLDEPTSGLDPLMEQEFRRCVAEAADRGQTVFLSSHHLAEPDRLVTVTGYRTFAQVAWAGSLEGQTTIGLGVRALLSFRVVVLPTPAGTRVVVDVAHRW